jgi:DNA polymerase/3'-5' exonuclease PolX
MANEKFIELLNKIEFIYKSNGETFKVKATATAIESIKKLEFNLTNVKQLEGIKGVGKSIKTRFIEFLETGNIKFIDEELSKPFYAFTDIYGVGPKKAKELAEKFKSIEELKKNTSVLNSKQKIGLKYYEDIKKRIPRKVIDDYDKKFKEIFAKYDVNYEIVGSYRRGATNSGDIDVIFKSDDEKVFDKIISELKKQNVIQETLSKGKHKSMTICKIDSDKYGRRVDFMVTSVQNYPFAILYFTGNKDFNVKMREISKSKGFTLNEYLFQNVKDNFKTEKDIFKFLEIPYVEPNNRNANAI